MLDVQVNPRAQLDLESVYMYIAVNQGAPAAADRLLDEIYHAIRLTAEYPDRGELYNRSALEREYRRILVKSYWVFYTHDDEALSVWRILHVRRDIDDSTLVEM